MKTYILVFVVSLLSDENHRSNDSECSFAEIVWSNVWWYQFKEYIQIHFYAK